MLDSILQLVLGGGGIAFLWRISSQLGAIGARMEAHGRRLDAMEHRVNNIPECPYLGRVVDHGS